GVMHACELFPGLLGSRRMLRFRALLCSPLVLLACPSEDPTPAKTETKSTTTKPGQPEAVEPKPAEPKPVEPKPVEPKPTGPVERQPESGEVHFTKVVQLTFGGENAEAYLSFAEDRLTFQSKRDTLACDQIFTMGLDGSDVKMISS